MLSRSSLFGAVIAVLGAGSLLLFDRFIASPGLRDFALSVGFILTVVLASAIGGWKPGALATVLGMAVHLWAFVEPRFELKLPDQREILRILAYSIAGGSISMLSEALQRAWDRIRDRQRQLELDAQRKNEFLATLAHELRNPLAPLRSGLQVLRLSGRDPAVVDECVAMMERQLAHTVRLVDDLLDVSRISRVVIELRKQPVALEEIIRHAVETSRSSIDEAAHELTINLPAGACVVDGDLTRLTQVVSNLLNNAARYTEPGGRIALTAEREGREAVIRVRDNGIGIPAAMLPQLFEMFTQVDPSMRRAQGGLGIGLALAKVLVELHGGTLSGSSDGPGKGAEFMIRLPLSSEPATTIAPAAETPTGTESSAQILIVDDNQDVARSLALLLRHLGHEITIAHDGLAAIETARQSRPDVILLDIGLPDIDGYEVCRSIRASGWGKQMLIVAITGWGQQEDRRRSREAGFDDHLIKPVAPNAIDALLAKLSASRSRPDEAKRPEVSHSA
jgi:signal transduction histidine kinase/CheY-like chemotaxis protein